MTKNKGLGLKKNKNKRKLLWVLIPAVVVVATLIGAYVIIKQSSHMTQTTSTSQPTNTVDYNEPTAEEKDATAQQKEDLIKQYESTPTSDATIAVSITRASQESAGQPLNIRVFIDGLKEGECKVTLTKSGQPKIEKSFPIAFEGTGSVCKDADIAASNFAKSGEWSLEVIAVGGQRQSPAATEKVDIQL